MFIANCDEKMLDFPHMVRTEIQQKRTYQKHKSVHINAKMGK